MAQTTLIDGTQTTELLTLSPSHPSETSNSWPSSSSLGSCMGIGTVVRFGMSAGPKRSIDHMSSLSPEVTATSLTTLGSATILAFGKRELQHRQPEMMIGMEVRHVDVGEVLPHLDDLGDHPVGVAQQLRRIDQDRVALPVEQGGVAVEPEVAVQEDLVLQWHMCSLLALPQRQAS